MRVGTKPLPITGFFLGRGFVTMFLLMNKVGSTVFWLRTYHRTGDR